MNKLSKQQVKQNLPISLRPGTIEDLAFISSSWFQSNREHEGVIYPIYKDFFNALIVNIINRSVTIISCNPKDLDQIFGYIVFEQFNNKPVIHYVYVKSLYRGYGIGKKLFDQVSTNGFYYTSKPMKALDKGIYCPFLRYGEFYEQGSKESSNRPKSSSLL